MRHLGAAQPLLQSCGPGVPGRHSPALSCLRCGAPARLRTVLNTWCRRDLYVSEPVQGNQSAVSLCFSRATAHHMFCQLQESDQCLIENCCMVKL